MRKSLTLIISLALVINLALVTACGPKTPTAKLAVYSANAQSALIAVTDSVDRLNRAGRIKAAAAKTAYSILGRVDAGLAILRARVQSGYKKADALGIVTAIIEDVRQAEAEGVVGLSGKEREQFLRIIFFAQFSLNSLKAVIEATKEPPLPPLPTPLPTVADGTRAARATDDTVWTDLVLILQTAVLRGISQSRMTESEAFADGAALSVELKASIASKLAALGV